MRKLFIETVGCQMNMLDSELVVATLRKEGYELTDSTRQADTVLFNTCSVRQHAEDKIYSALGRLKHAKRHRPDLVIGVVGCMAQKDQKKVFHRAPHVDVVVGPGQLSRLPELIEQVRRERAPVLAVSLGRNDGSHAEIQESFESYDPLRDPQMRPSSYQAFVRIMIGCDKFCTYCVVPSVRGPEQSRHPGQVEAEVRKLAGEGCKEVTLLGQTVNSYRYVEGDRQVRLSDLLEKIHDTPGIERIRFITNFPKHMTDDLLEAVRDLPKVCPYLHVPAQSGCDEMLRRMKRGYSVGEYHDMLARIRHFLPAAAVSSDFIVGFCGETDASFERTCDLVRDARFKNSFIFKYSTRPGTKAHVMMPDDVPDEVKRHRNNTLLALQNEISLQDNRDFVARRVEVLVEGLSKTAKKRNETDGPVVQLTGRTPCDRIVVFPGNRRLTGQLVEVEIEQASGLTLFGSVSTGHRVGMPLPVLQ